MILLMLNFQALFKVNHNTVHDAFLENDVWLEVEEVVMGMMAMVDFLIELHLLQLTRSPTTPT